jgi:hypothetical protein
MSQDYPPLLSVKSTVCIQLHNRTPHYGSQPNYLHRKILLLQRKIRPRLRVPIFWTRYFCVIEPEPCRTRATLVSHGGRRSCEVLRHPPWRADRGIATAPPPFSREVAGKQLRRHHKPRWRELRLQPKRSRVILAQRISPSKLGFSQLPGACPSSGGVFRTNLIPFEA